MLKSFDYTELNNPEFKEDAVKEELITPLLKALGYDYNGRFKIIRSRRLNHPFNMIGSQKHNVSIIPDYILECDGKSVCVIDAKSPSKNLNDERYIGQVYSYAVHREVSAKFFALCNGREFVLYETGFLNPKMTFYMKYIGSHFQDLEYIIGNKNILASSKSGIKKDLGIHLKMLFAGNHRVKLFFYDLPISQIALVEPNIYTVDSNIVFNEEEYCGSFDFSYELLLQIEHLLPNDSLEKLRDITKIPIVVEFAGKRFVVGIECELGDKIYENINEQYMPLKITGFSYAEWR